MLPTSGGGLGGGCGGGGGWVGFEPPRPTVSGCDRELSVYFLSADTLKHHTSDSKYTHLGKMPIMADFNSL